ncbi:MAG: hypothetical protein JSR77_03880 [Planctomycetes bacterium]|nr:hypothetical protein [Planctomycetota bacterium]
MTTTENPHSLQFANTLRALLYTLALTLSLVCTPAARADVDFTQVSGDWAADWSGRGTRGWLQITINQAGVITGDIALRSEGSFGTIRAQAQASGAFHGAIHILQNQYPVTGTLRVSKGNLAATLEYNDGQGNFRASMTLRRYRETPVPAAFAGDWGGTLRTPAIPDFVPALEGVIRLNVDATGHVDSDAFFLHSVDGPTLTGSILANGLFRGVLTFQGEQSQIVADVRRSGPVLVYNFYAHNNTLGLPPTFRVELRTQTASTRAGNWRGTCLVGTRLGTVELTISVDGRATGRISFPNAPITVKFELVILNSGVFAGVYDTDGNLRILSGRISSNRSVLSANAISASGDDATRFTLSARR